MGKVLNYNNNIMSNPKFSILVATYNQLDVLPRLFESLSEQTFKDFEVIFVDDHSVDGTKEFFRAEPQFNFKYSYHRPRFKKHLAKILNIGMKKAAGDYIVFIMGDSFPELNYLEILKDKVDEDALVCGIRIQIDHDRAVDVDWRIIKEKIPQHEAIVINEPFSVLTGNGLTIPRSAFLKHGGLDTKMKDYGGEDVILLAKLYYKGYVCKSAPSLVLYHHWHKSGDATKKNEQYTLKQIIKHYHA